MIGAATTTAGLSLALYVSFQAYQQGGLFAWHPFCMSMGALGLSTATIQAVRSRRTVEGIQSKTQRVQVRQRHEREICMVRCILCIGTVQEWHGASDEGELLCAFWVQMFKYHCRATNDTCRSSARGLHKYPSPAVRLYMLVLVTL